MNVTQAYDITAETNSAFCAYLLRNFVRDYASINAAGPEFPLAYLALPLALSGDLQGTFEGTNRTTGLAEWLFRSPAVRVELSERLNGTLEIVTTAVRFSCFSRAIELSTQGRLCLGALELPNRPITKLTPSSRQAFTRAERLGAWFASAGSTEAVFDMFGVTL